MAKKAIWGAAYLAAVTLFVFVSCEIFLRFLLPKPQSFFVFEPYSVFNFQADPVHTPGVEGVGRFIVNSLGLRSDEVPADAQRRILVFGGSTTVEVYLDQDEMWTKLVQDKINVTPHQPKTWVGNMGRSSQATLHNLLQFDLMVPNLPRADLFLNLAGVNDLQMALRSSYLRDMTLEDHLNWTFTVRPRSEGWRQLATVRFYERVADWWKRSRTSVVQTYQAEGFTQWRRCRQSAPMENLVDLPDISEGVANYRLNLNKLIDRAEAYGAPIVFMTQPTIWREIMESEDEALLFAGGVGPNNEWCEKKRYFSPRALTRGMAKFNQVLLEVCGARNIHCIDLASRIPKKRAYFYDDMHLSEEGARRVADEIVKSLLEFERATRERAAARQ